MVTRRSAGLRLALWALFVAGASLPAVAHGFAPPAPGEAAPVPGKAGPPLSPERARAMQQALQQAPAWIAWSAQHPGWRVQWNLRTGTPHRLYGPGVRLASPPTAAGIESACRKFLAATQGLTGVEPAELALVRAVLRRGRWTVVFEQLHAGLPVRGARIDLRLGEAGEVALFGSDWHRAVRVDPVPALDAEAASAIAARGLARAPGTLPPVLVIVPEPHDAGCDYRLAWELRFRSTEPPGDWLAWVDAHDGTLLQLDNRIRWAQLSGTIAAAVESVTVGDPYAERPLDATRFDVGQGTLEYGYTGPEGTFEVTTAASDSVGVRTRLAGLYGRIYNYSLGYATPALGARMLPGTRRDFRWDDSNSRASERDAYFHVLLARQAVRRLDPSFTALDYQMPIIVDVDIDDCNAYYDGFQLNFFGESTRCANTARIADVVIHEYAHAITDHLYRPFAPSPAMAEGFSDYRAASLTDQPLVGRGFHGPGTWLRTVDNTNRYPEDWTGEEHHDGLILAGALWDLRQAVGPGLADTLQHYACYGGADNYDDYFLDVLAADDDDGDLYDGTPHFDAIVDAFSAHGIGDYSVHIAHTPLQDTEDLAKPLGVPATILSVFALEAASLELRYAVDGGPWAALPLAPAGTGSRDYMATIPAQAAGSVVRYVLAASDVRGHTALLPGLGETAPYEFRVGTDTTPPVIAHLPLADQPLDGAGWRIEATVTDNLDRGPDSVWVEWSRTSAALDEHLPLGATSPSVWAATLAPAGASLGDSIRYRIVAVDSAAVPNQATSPSAGYHGFRVVRGFARDFEATDGGLAPSGDWQWGTPAAGPAAHSGTHLWGTGLAGTYNNDRHSYLETGPIDLAGWTHAGLVFEHAVDTEPLYDGGNVQLTSDDGGHWVTLIPSGGYPQPVVNALGEPGWSGEGNGWERAEFDLSRYRGQTIRLRWHFAADAGVVARGWFLDDLQVAASQVLSVPLRLRAESGHDGEVPLRWDAPAGIDPAQSDTPLLGYHVYRASRPDLADAARLTPTPLASAAYVDGGLVNGTTWHYAVTALYAAGESRPSASTAAQPFRAAYACDASSLYVWVPQGGGADTTLAFQNTGTGTLRLNAWLGDWFDPTVDRVRIAYTVPNGDPAGSTVAPSGTGRTPGGAAEPVRWQLLLTDAAEGANPDLARLYAAPRGDLVLLKLTGWTAWGDPLADFNLVFGFDTDANRGTGDSHGDDLYVQVGPHVLSEVGAPARIITPAQETLGVPPHQHFPSGADSLEVGLPASLLGGAGQRVYLRVRALGTDMLSSLDGLPSARSLSTWIEPQSLALDVPAGAPTTWTLTFPGTTPPGHHVGRIFLETNAPGTPVVTLPVVYDFATTPVAVRDLAAVTEGPDVVVRWHAAGDAELRAFRLFRARDGSPAVPLAPDVPAAAAGAYTYRDPNPEPGRYEYRLGGVDGAGLVTLLGAAAVTVTSRVPLASFLAPPAPNPFNPATTLRFGLARAARTQILVYDARGRLVRALVRAAPLEAGYGQVVWDGRDDAGARVASGVYTAELRSGGQRFTRRLILVK